MFTFSMFFDVCLLFRCSSTVIGHITSLSSSNSVVVNRQASCIAQNSFYSFILLFGVETTNLRPTRLLYRQNRRNKINATISYWFFKFDELLDLLCVCATWFQGRTAATITHNDIASPNYSIRRQWKVRFFQLSVATSTTLTGPGCCIDALTFIRLQPRCLLQPSESGST